MQSEVKQKLDSIFSYPFFQAVGRPVTGSLRQVDDWNHAVEASNRKGKWENCRLMARNALQRFVEERCWDRGQEWNPLTDALRPLIVEFVDALSKKTTLPKIVFGKIKDDLCWDIMFICLEYNYRDLVKPIFYLPLLDPWYAAGHFPCGWDGEEFPVGWDGMIRGGRLIVF